MNDHRRPGVWGPEDPFDDLEPVITRLDRAVDKAVESHATDALIEQRLAQVFEKYPEPLLAPGPRPDELLGDDAATWSARESYGEGIPAIGDAADAWLRFGDKKYAIHDVERIWITPVRARRRAGIVAAALVLIAAAAGVLTAVDLSWPGFAVLAAAVAVTVAVFEIRRLRKVQHQLWLRYRGEEVLVVETSNADMFKEMWSKAKTSYETKKRSDLISDI
jgi:hypothetical protein